MLTIAQATVLFPNSESERGVKSLSISARCFCCIITEQLVNNKLVIKIELNNNLFLILIMPPNIFVIHKS